MDTIRSDQQNGSTGASSFNAQSEVDPLDTIFDAVNRLVLLGHRYLLLGREKVAFQLRAMLINVAIGAVLAIAGCALVITALILLCIGLAKLGSYYLSDVPGAGEALVGFLIILTLAIVVGAGVYFKRKRSIATLQAAWSEGGVPTSRREPSPEHKFLDKEQQRTKALLARRVEELPNDLKSTLSLDAWAKHHPWITVAGPAILGGVLAAPPKPENDDDANGRIKESASPDPNHKHKNSFGHLLSDLTRDLTAIAATTLRTALLAIITTQGSMGPQHNEAEEEKVEPTNLH